MESAGRRYLLLLFVLFVSTAVGQTGQLGQGRNSITGFVFGDNRAPVSRVNIELQTELYSMVGRTQTNGGGMFSFRGLPSGSYVIKVVTIGTNYEEQTRSVSLIPISAVAGAGAVSEQVDIYLRPRKNPNALDGPGGVVFAQEVPKNAQSLYESGIQDLESKKEAEGYEKLKQALEAFPDYFLALDRLATEYLAKGHFEAAQVLFTKAISVNSRSISSGLGLGIAEFRLNRLDKAIEAFNEVLKLDKESVNAHYWKGIVLHSSNKLNDAQASLEKAEKLSGGKFADAYFQLARVYKDQKKFRESADSLEAFLKLKPDAENSEQIRQVIKTLRDKQVS